MTFKRFSACVLAFALSAGTAIALPAQTAKQDMKDAGHDTKGAAVDTGHATKRVTKKAAHKTKRAAVKSKNATENFGDRVADKPETHPK